MGKIASNIKRKKARTNIKYAFDCLSLARKYLKQEKEDISEIDFILFKTFNVLKNIDAQYKLEKKLEKPSPDKSNNTPKIKSPSL